MSMYVYVSVNVREVRACVGACVRWGGTDTSLRFEGHIENRRVQMIYFVNSSFINVYVCNVRKIKMLLVVVV